MNKDIIAAIMIVGVTLGMLAFYVNMPVVIAEIAGQDLIAFNDDVINKTQQAADFAIANQNLSNSTDYTGLGE